MEQVQYCKQVVEEFIRGQTGKSVIVFTDGSVLNGGLGPGACSAVLMDKNAEDHRIISKPVGQAVDILTCEIEGIILGLELATEVITKSDDGNGSAKELYICCDSKGAVDEVMSMKRLERRPESLMYIRKKIDYLYDIGVQTMIVWIPGHVNVTLNEMANNEAKKVANQIVKGQVKICSSVSVEGAYTIVSQVSKSNWQKMWETSTTGEVTRSYVPTVGVRLRFPKIRKVSVSYCRLLLDDTMLNDDAYKCKLCPSPTCSCGRDRETVDHYLLHCVNHKLHRSDMMQRVRKIWMETKPPDQHVITKEFLLAPCWYQDLSNSQDAEVKSAVFDYILASARNC